MQKNTAIFAGIMSGTSTDGTDGILARFTPGQAPLQLGSHYQPFDSHLKSLLLALAASKSCAFEQLAEAEHLLTHHYAQTLKQLQVLTPNINIRAAGCHGQTLEHRPSGPHPYTLQLLNPSLLSELTGIDIICDFRRRDLAAGGQGAPLVPAFHQHCFQSTHEPRFIVNLGGIANITWLPPGPTQTPLGFDTGPANLLLDAWMQQVHQKPCDQDGETARSGEINEQWLAALLDEPYFTQAWPKSTGREQFNINWVKQRLPALHETDFASVTMLTTLAELTAESLAQPIRQLDPQSQANIYLCGGGAYNTYLVERIRARLEPRKVDTTDSLGMPPSQVEAFAFAWLAWRFMEGQPNNLASATGASGPRRLGGHYPAR